MRRWGNHSAVRPKVVPVARLFQLVKPAGSIEHMLPTMGSKMVASVFEISCLSRFICVEKRVCDTFVDPILQQRDAIRSAYPDFASI